MPNDWFTSLLVFNNPLAHCTRHLCPLRYMCESGQSFSVRRNSVSYQARPSASQVFREFHCRECGPQDALRSRPRGFFEKHILPLLFLRVVRCERCYHRRYIFRSVPVKERYSAERKAPQRACVSDSTRRHRQPPHCIASVRGLILAEFGPAKHHRLAGCGRPSSAVLGFEYGLPRAKRQSLFRRSMVSLMTRQSVASLA
jgi:hypothetical protein